MPGASGAVAAIFEKEFRYLSRSGPMLFTLVMPVVILLLFRLAPTGSRHGDNFLVNAPDLAFPIGAAYTLLLVVNLVYNSLGPDAVGIQFFFASPVRFRDIMLAKNLAHASIVAMETFAVWLVVCLMFRPPSLGVTFATLAAMLYGAPVNLAGGICFSLYSPKKIDYGTFGRQRATGLTAKCQPCCASGRDGSRGPHLYGSAAAGKNLDCHACLSYFRRRGHYRLYAGSAAH